MGGGHHRDMEIDVCVHERRVGLARGIVSGVEGTSHSVDIGIRATLGSQSSGVDLDDPAHLLHLGQARTLHRRSDIDRNRVGDDENTRTLTRSHEPSGSEHPDGLSNGGSTDAQVLREGRLAGQLRSDRPFARTDASAQFGDSTICGAEMLGGHKHQYRAFALV